MPGYPSISFTNHPIARFLSVACLLCCTLCLGKVYGQQNPQQLRIQQAADSIAIAPNDQFNLCRQACYYWLDQCNAHRYDRAKPVFWRILGIACYYQGAYDSAVQHYQQSIRWAERIKDLPQMSLGYNELGNAMRKLNRFQDAKSYLWQASKIATETGQVNLKARTNNNLGVVYETMQQLDSATSAYQLALLLYRMDGDSVGVSYSLENLAIVSGLTQQPNLATSLMLQAIAVREGLKVPQARALGYLNLSEILKEAKSYPSAIRYSQMSDSLALAMHYPDLHQRNLALQADIAAATGNYQQAWQLNIDQEKVKDSLFNQKTTEQVMALQQQFEVQKKQQLITEQQFAISRRNYGLAAMLLLVVTTITGGWWWFRRRQLLQQKQLQQTIIEQQDLATKAVLEAEENERKRIALDLHDGVGQMMSAVKMNLSALESRLSIPDEEEKNALNKIMALVDESCKEVRNVSHNMMPNALLKSGLSNAVKDFIDKIDHHLLKVNLYAEGLQERLDSNVETVLYRIIQECVNNVIKHAKASALDISLIKEKDNISITIEDNGRGFNNSQRNSFQGIGLKNIQARINYLEGTVDFDSAPGKGTLVAIYVPLKA